MNLNKLLCKYLDQEGRGYVTIGDVVLPMGILATPFLIIATFGKNPKTSGIASFEKHSTFLSRELRA